MAAHVHLICGLPGAGKSTHAEALRRSLPGLRFSIDDWNARLFFPDRHPTSDFGWFYERVQRSCAQMREVAQQALEIGVPVIFDCGLTDARERAIFGDWAEALGVPVTLHWIDVDATERWKRVMARNAEQGETFRLEVTREMFDFMEQIWEPPLPEEAARWRLERVTG
jgi:predicted kinase